MIAADRPPRYRSVVSDPGLELLRLPGGPMRVAWRRSTRARRISLRIDPRDGLVIVTLPPRATRPAGMALLIDHAAWVSARLAALPGHTPFADGACVRLHGLDHVIRHVPDMRGGAWLDGREILVAGEARFLARRIDDFMREEASRRFGVLVAQKAALVGVRPRRVVVKDTRSRWGSCAANRTLAFSWRLVMAPRFVQDYVAAHEVAHLRHMNHGERFWALVRCLTPESDGAMAWLRAEGPRLLRVG